MQHLDLSDEEAAALVKELADITGNDRYPFSARIQTLRAILAKLKPEPAREPLPPPKVYTTPGNRGRDAPCRPPVEYPTLRLPVRLIKTRSKHHMGGIMVIDPLSQESHLRDA